MPVFQLSEQIIFPHPDLAEPDGLLAVGGDLSVRRLITAYRHGIFPWYSDRDPILWWFTSPRLVLFPEELKVSKRLQRYYRNSGITMSIDRCFDEVIEQCRNTRKKRHEDTWITDEMLNAYRQLHRHGYAHSVECWQQDVLVGGLYGIALGRVFFGESMFSIVANSSKLALIYLVKFLISHGFQLIDCQMTTDLLVSMGAREISGSRFQGLLKKYIHPNSDDGVWPHEKSG